MYHKYHDGMSNTELFEFAEYLEKEFGLERKNMPKQPS
jgi:hypothetical protein